MLEWLSKMFSAAGTGGVGTSMTVMSGVLIFVSQVVNAWFGTGVMPEGEVATFQQSVTAMVTNGLSALGIVGVWWGRVRAKKQVASGSLT